MNFLWEKFIISDWHITFDLSLISPYSSPLLRRISNVAMTWDKCKSNPLNKVKFFKESPPKERILSHEEEKTLPDSSPNHIRPILITALNTGMRYRELLNLKWDDVDLDSNYIHVKTSKTGKDRKIPINQTLRNPFRPTFTKVC